jgi:hypothetical protein
MDKEKLIENFLEAYRALRKANIVVTYSSGYDYFEDVTWLWEEKYIAFEKDED